MLALLFMELKVLSLVVGYFGVGNSYSNSQEKTKCCKGHI